MNFKEAINSNDANEWIEAMNDEINSIKNNDVWEHPFWKKNEFKHNLVANVDKENGVEIYG